MSWGIKFKIEEVSRNMSSRVSLGCTPGSLTPLTCAKERRLRNFTLSSEPSNHPRDYGTTSVRWDHTHNLSSLRAPQDQDTPLNNLPEGISAALLSSHLKWSPLSFFSPTCPFFILKGLCHEPSSSVISPVTATQDRFPNWRINLSEKTGDGQF